MQGLSAQNKDAIWFLPDWLQRHGLLAYTVVVLTALQLAVLYPRIADAVASADRFAPENGRPFAVVDLHLAEAAIAAQSTTEMAAGPTNSGAEPDAIIPEARALSGYEIAQSDGSTLGDKIDTSSGFVQISKPIAYEGQALGQLQVNVDREAQLAVQISEIKDRLKDLAVFHKSLGSLPDGGRVSFQTLRRAGIDLRYDATSDQINVRSN